MMKPRLPTTGTLLDITLAIAVSFVAILALYYRADWWSLNTSPSWPYGQLLLLRVFAALMLAILGVSLGRWLIGCGRRGRLIFTAWLIAAVILFAIIWPGYLMSDSIAALKYSLELPFNLWLGFVTPFFVSAILQLIPYVWALSACQLLLAAAVLAYASEMIVVLSGRRIYAIVFAAVIVASPALVYNFGLQARDTLFSLVSLWLVAFVAGLGHRHRLRPAVLLLAGVISGLAATIRGMDGWFVLLPLLVIVPWLVRDKSLSGMYVGATVCTLVLFAYILPKNLGKSDDAFRYAVANTVNPLGYVLQNKFSTDHGNNLVHIGKVVDVEKIRKEQNPYEIPAWWSGGLIQPDVAPEYQAGYPRYVSAYLRENIAVFLASRMHTFSAATGLSEQGFKMDDMYRSKWPTDWVPPERYHVDLTAGRPFPEAFSHLSAWLEDSARFDPRFLSGSAIFWNFLPWLVLLFIVMLGRQHALPLRLAILIVVARLPIVFLGAPASQFKYYLPVLLCGSFVLPLALQKWLETIKRQKMSVGTT